MLAPSITVGLSPGWQLALTVPVEARHVSLLATPAAPAEAGWVAGPSDGRLVLQGFHAFAPGWVVGGGLGLSLPIGDPGRVGGVAGAPRRLGTGGIDPLASLRLISTEGRFGAFVSVDGRVGLFEAVDGFTAPTSVSASAGALWRPVKFVAASLTAEYQHDTPMRFWGVPAEMPHDQLGLAVGVYPELRPGMVAQAVVRALPWASRTPGEVATQPISASLGLSWTFDLNDH